MIYASDTDYSVKHYEMPCSVVFWPDKIEGRKLMHSGRIEQLRNWIEKRLESSDPIYDIERFAGLVHLYETITVEPPIQEELPARLRRAIVGTVSAEQSGVRVVPSTAVLRSGDGSTRNRSPSHHGQPKRTLGLSEQPDHAVQAGS